MKNVPERHFFPFFILFILGIGISMPAAQAQSVLASGKWYKVAVEKNGVYKISDKTFKKMGFDLSKTDPRKIRIYGNEGGMLPQANQTVRPSDLVEHSIFVAGETDGKFNTDDFILFYAQGADKYSYDQDKGIIAYEKNLYADKNYYFITVSESNGKRISTDAAISGNLPVVNSFENFSCHELDEYSELKSGREWFGERFDLTTEITFDADIQNVIPGSNLKFVSAVMAKSFSGTSFTIAINNQSILTQNISPIEDQRYGIKGAVRNDTIDLAASESSPLGSSVQKIKYTYNKAPSGTSVGFLNYFLLQATQNLVLSGNQTIFRSPASLENPASQFDIESSAAATVWDVTNPYEPIVQPASFASGKTSFKAITSVLKEFVVFDNDVPGPELIGSVSNQNLHGLATPRLIIITHPDFKSEADRLAAYRNSKNITAEVVTTTQVYHEFSSGRQDVTAIRDFVKFLYDKSPTTLKSVLLVGKGSYDYKSRVIDNLNFVPTYESRNSLHPVDSYSSDDYFGFLDDNEGLWSESPAVNHTMDVAVGRLPVKEKQEASNIVDKIIRYESAAALQGFWQKEIAFVADDGDSNLHQDDADELAESINENHPAFDVSKIYLDQFPQISRPSGEISPETNEAIEDRIEKGALILNYTGHGGERLLAQERIFDDLMIADLENERLPVLITATCEFGKVDDPQIISGAELCLIRENGGAIALVATGRPVEASKNFILNQAFYNAFFQLDNNNNPLTLGEIFRRTKNGSVSGVSNRNFSLIGDPELQLALPSRTIVVSNITTESGSTTLKSLSTVTVRGEITDVNGTDETFNGVLEAVLFDKEVTFQTLGDENSPYTYKQWYNRIFRGKASVEEGAFEFTFVVPKNIAYQVAAGKLSLYARDSVQDLTASGYSKSFDIGLSESNPETDNTSPVISLYVGDTTFISGGITNPNTTLVARLSDEHGINISGYGIGNSLTAILDGESFNLNDFYVADINDYSKGTVTFPLKNLNPGKHTLTLKAWDTYNNPAQATIEFRVTESEDLVIQSFGNYPNPFQTSTMLSFTHNRSGDDLEGTVVLYDLVGNTLNTYHFSIPSSSYQVDLLELVPGVNFIKNQPGGLYFARLSIRSLTNGSKNEQVTKLILSN